MGDVNLMDQLAALNAAIQTIPIRTREDRKAVERLEEVKQGLDDARLGLWARLQSVHSDDIRTYEERFRARRATELCHRLTTDLRLGVVNPGHPEFADLWIAAVDLGQAIQAARARMETGQGGSPS